MKVAKNNIKTNIKYRDILLNVFLPLFLFLIGFITFYIPDTVILPDMANYLNWGLNIFNGKGYVDELWQPVFNKSPLWIFMITLSYHLFGISPESPFVFIRLFAILNPLVIYFLCKFLYNQWLGFSSALLVLTSYSLCGASYYNYDTIWPFFVLTGFLFMYLAFEKKSYLCFIAAAVGMAIAYLIKDKLIVIFPMPFLLLMYLKVYRNKTNFYGTLIYAGTFFLISLPWIFHVWSLTHRLDLAILGVKLAQLKDSFLDVFYAGQPEGFNGIIQAYAIDLSNPIFSLRQFLAGLTNYYHGGFWSVQPNFTLAPLFLISWVYLVIGCIKKDKRSTILVFPLLMLLPLISFLGLTDYRISQLIIFFHLSYIALSVFAIDLSTHIVNLSQRIIKRKNVKVLTPYIAAFLVVILIFLQIFAKHERDKGYRKFIKRSLIWQKLTKDKNAKTDNLAIKLNLPLKFREVYGAEPFQEVVGEIKALLKHRDDILVAGLREARAVYFYLDGHYRVYETPFKKCRPSQTRSKSSSADAKMICKKINKKINAIYIRANNDWSSKRYVHHILPELRLIRFIKKHRIKYILTTPKNPGLEKYFARSSLFRKINLNGRKSTSPDTNFHFFQVLQTKFANNNIKDLTLAKVQEPIVTPYFSESMRKLSSDNPNAYKKMVDQCLCRNAGLSPDQVHALVFE